MSPAAGFVFYSDPAGGLARMRQQVSAARSVLLRDPFLRDLDARTGGALSSSLFLPNIVHSSFLRFARKPSDPAAFARGFEDIAAQWVPARVVLDRVSLVYETVPYMHAARASSGAVTYELVGRTTADATTGSSGPLQSANALLLLSACVVALWYWSRRRR